MRAAMQDFARREEHVQSDSCFVVLMSHGDANGICGVFDSFSSDDEEDILLTDDIFNSLNTPNCAGLRDKPKIILIQACRGGEQQNILVENKVTALNSTDQNVRIFDWLETHPVLSTDVATCFDKCFPYVIGKAGSVDVQDSVPRNRRRKEHREKDFCCLMSCTPGK